MVPDVSEVFLLGIMRSQDEEKKKKGEVGAEKGEKKSSMATQSHTAHTEALHTHTEAYWSAQGCQVN